MIKSIVAATVFASLAISSALAGNSHTPPTPKSQAQHQGFDAFAQGKLNNGAPRVAPGTRPTSAPYLPGAYNNISR